MPKSNNSKSPPKKRKVEKGILGVAKNPKKQMLFFFGKKDDDMWDSDSDDPDFDPRRDSDDSLSGSEKIPKRKGPLVKRSFSKARSQGVAKKAESETRPSTVTTVKKSSQHCQAKTSGQLSRSSHSSSQHGSAKKTDYCWGLRLPELALAKIFAYVVTEEGALPFLARAMRVCKLWYRMAKHNSLWTRVDLSYGWIRRDRKTLDTLCSTRLSLVREINFTGWTVLNDDLLKLVVRSCPLLSSVILDGCNITDSGLSYLTDNSQHLSHIQLSIIKATVGRGGVKYLINKRGAHLKSISLSDTQLESYQDILVLIAGECAQLERLSLHSVRYMSQFMYVNIEALQAGCPRLKSLRFINCNVKQKPTARMDQEASKGFPCLQELDLSIDIIDPVGHTCVASEGKFGILHRLLKESKDLKKLHLQGRSDVYYDILPELPITDLETLYLSNRAACKHCSLDELLNKWKHSLVEVDISWNIYTEGSLVKAMKYLASDPIESQLKVLDVTGTAVTGRAVRRILRGCPRLETLRLESCRSLPRGMKRDYSGPELRALCHQIDDLVS